MLVTIIDTWFLLNNFQYRWRSLSLQQQLKSTKLQSKFNDIISGVDFTPVAIEMSGVWGRQAFDRVAEIGRKIAAVTHEPRTTVFLRQRISVAVERRGTHYVPETLKVKQHLWMWSVNISSNYNLKLTFHPEMYSPVLLQHCEYDNDIFIINFIIIILTGNNNKNNNMGKNDLLFFAEF